MLILKKAVEAWGWEAFVNWRARTLRNKIHAYRGIKQRLSFLENDKTIALIMKHHGRSIEGFTIGDEHEEIRLKSQLSAIEQEIKVLRRNRALVKQIGRQFADYIQAEFNVPCDASLMAFPEYYTPNRYVPYKFLAYRIQTFQPITVVDSEYIPVTETIKYEVQPIPFGDLKGYRIYAGWHPETYTVYLGEMYHKDDKPKGRY